MNKLQSNLSVVLCAILFASPATADIVFDSIGVLEADSVKKFGGMRQHGIQLGYRVMSTSNAFWIPTNLDFAAGWIERGGDAAAFVSVGPSYRMHLTKTDQSRWFADFGSHPTYVSQSHFGGKSLGGKFFFTSYLGLGAYLDRKRKTALLLRYQHTSNAGLSDTNPGVDMLGLTFSYHFSGARRQITAENTDQNK